MKRFLLLSLFSSMIFANLLFCQGDDELGRTTVLFGHGFGGDRNHVDQYVDYGMLPECQTMPFDFPDSPRIFQNGNRLNLARSSVWQKNEIDVFENVYSGTKEEAKKDNGKIIVGGVSRGGSCALSGNFEGADGIFAESPVAHMKDMIGDSLKQFAVGWVPFLGRIINKFFIHRFIGRYNPSGSQPINRVEDIPRETPVLISYTTQDQVVPPSSSVKLAERLYRSGHRNLYVWGTNTGQHGNIVYGRDGQNYRTVFRAFLRRCGALSPEYDSEEGNRMLENARVTSLPNLVRLRRRLQWNEWKKYWGRNLATFATVSAAALGVLYKLFG